MTTTITPEAKNNLTITNESKGKDQKWSEKKGTWADQGKSTWAVQRMVMLKESKNALSITNESKL